MGLKKLVAYWFLAGLAVTILGIIWSVVTGGWVGGLTELIIDYALEPLFFPFDLLIGWTLNPFSVILQIVFFAVITYYSEKQ